jgi:DnaK suppressor protein
MVGPTMDKKRLDYYKKKLQARREELIRTIARTEEEGRKADDDPTVDLADKAANSYTKEFLFGQTNVDRNLLALIDGALLRIKNGTYGVCAECEEELQQKRLEAVPWARHCVVCAEKHERGLL